MIPLPLEQPIQRCHIITLILEYALPGILPINAKELQLLHNPRLHLNLIRLTNRLMLNFQKPRMILYIFESQLVVFGFI